MNKTSAYKNFFVKSEDGKELIEWINNQIQRYHNASEDNPSIARDNSQRAKGMRDILDHIEGVIITGGQKEK